MDNFKYEAINDLVNRLQLLCIPGLGKITLAMNKITGFTVKIQNVVRYSASALRVPYPVCECTPHASPFWDPCKVDFPLTYCEEIKVKVFKQL